MPRSYKHIEEYEIEIIRMKNEGKTKKEIIPPKRTVQLRSYMWHQQKGGTLLRTAFLLCR